MPTTRLDTADAIELTELLQFVKEWLTSDNEAKASFARFVGNPCYNAAGLCADIERFSFLLGGNDGEHLLMIPCPPASPIGCGLPGEDR
jgi:hypothetical protein